MAKNGGNLLMGLTIFTVSTLAFAFLFGFGFSGGQQTYSQTKGMFPTFGAKYGKVYNARTAFVR